MSMSRKSINFEKSFEDIISIIPNALSYTSNENNASTIKESEMSKSDERLNKTSCNDLRSTSAAGFVSNANNEQAILSAIYNTLAIAIFVACLVLCGLLLIVLQAFVRSILWALLTSAFLFSFKRYLTDVTLKSLKSIEKNHSTIALEALLLPFRLINSSVDYVWCLFIDKYRQILVIVISIVLFHLASSFYQPLFDYSLSLFEFAYQSSNTIVYYIDNSWKITLTFVLAYIIAISFYWNDKHYKTQIIFKFLSLPIWFSIVFLSSKLMGSYRPWFTTTFIFLTCLGFYSFVHETVGKYKKKMIMVENVGEDDLDERRPPRSLSPLSSSMHSTNIDHITHETTLTEQEENETSTNIQANETDELSQTKPDILAATRNDTRTSNSSSLSNSFLKSAVHNIYQTSLYYYHSFAEHNDQTDGSKTENDTIKATKPSSLELEKPNRKRENSDKYFILLIWLFICVKLRFDMYIIIPVLVLIIRMLKLTFVKIYYLIFNNDNVKCYLGKVGEWIENRKSVLKPQPFALLIKLFLKGDLKLNHLLRNYIDNLITSLMIIVLSLGVLITVVLLAMQVHSESLELISLVSNILNENVYSKESVIREWVPEKEKLNQLYQATMNNFYLYGRDWLSKALKSSSDSKNTNVSEIILIESQLLKQWDSLYAFLSQKYIPNSFNLTNNKFNHTQQINETFIDEKLPPLAVPSKYPETRTIGTQTTIKANTKSVWKTFLNTNGEPFDYKNIILIVKDNFGILISILDSLYLIIKGNINLLSTILYTLISTMLSSSFALMNFVFSFIVYITALFYLLSMSGNRYKPFQWLTEISLPKNQPQSFKSLKAETKTTSKSDMLISAIEDSINSVFVVSLKMALFFGIYTYLINCMFSVSIVYLTAIVSALLAFLPLLGTYWCALFGVLELWLIHHKPLHAVLYLIMNLLPYILSVDKAIYSEIKTGHPYLSSLAFAGGVYCLGLEGVIIGPIVLCLFIVIAKMITSSNPNLGKTMIRRGTLLIKTPSVDKTD